MHIKIQAEATAHWDAVMLRWLPAIKLRDKLFLWHMHSFGDENAAKQFASTHIQRAERSVSTMFNSYNLKFLEPKISCTNSEQEKQEEQERIASSLISYKDSM